MNRALQEDKGARRWTRRAWLASSVVAAAAVGVAGMAPRATAAPAPRGGPITITFQFHWANGAPWNHSSVNLVQEFLDSTFNARHKGLRAVPWDICCGRWSEIVQASLAGSGYPDVIGECCTGFATLRDSQLLVPLDAYLRADNVNPNIWSRWHVEVLTYGGSLLGLPMYDGPQVLGYRQDILDGLGLSYPEPDWTYTDAVRIWRACASNANGHQRFGASLEWFPGWEYLFRGFGGTEMSADGTTCLVDGPECIQAAEWFYSLIFSGVATYRNDVSGLANGTEVFSAVGGWDIFNEATMLGTKMKWNLIPVPRFPYGRFTYVNKDFWALNRASQHPDMAWELLKWLAVESEWQRFIIRTALLEPALNQLWDEWEATVLAAAPPLRGIHLGYYRQAAQEGYAVPSSFYRYRPVTARVVVASGLAAIAARRVSVVEGMHTIAQQVNALERAAAAEPALPFAELVAAERKAMKRLARMFAAPPGRSS